MYNSLLAKPNIQTKTGDLTFWVRCCIAEPANKDDFRMLLACAGLYAKLSVIKLRRSHQSIEQAAIVSPCCCEKRSPLAAGVLRFVRLTDS